MADAALSALFDSAQPSRYKKPMMCADCGVLCVRTSAPQKRCRECAADRNRRLRAEWKDAQPRVNGKIGELFQCKRCGEDATRRHAQQIRCTSCKEIGRLEQIRESRPNTGTISAITICLECLSAPPKSSRAKYCDGCKKAVKSRRAKEFRANHKDKIAASKREHHAQNAEAIREKARKWREKTPERRNLNEAERRKSGRYRLRYAISNGIRISLKGGKRGRSWEKLVGYSCDDLARHLERQFLPGMSWDNFGEWHVDHIVPDSSFSYETSSDDDFKAAWALTNLRPLWAKDNVRKGAKRIYLI